VTRSKVFVVLAAYQGEKFIRQQVESIRGQTFEDWTLLARDDGSADGTGEVLRRLAAEDRRIQLLEGDGRRYGPAMNFARLLQEAFDRGAEYAFPSDQDDVWRPEKLDRQLAALRKGESAGGGRVPCLVYTDLAVVDERLQPVHGSFLRRIRLRQDHVCPLRTMLGRSFVRGGAAAVNRPLREFALPGPAAAVMHDWWLALSASAIGRIELLDEPLVLYRRHADNSTAPPGRWTVLNPWARSWQWRRRAITTSFRKSIEQARELRARLLQRAPEAPGDLRALLDEYLGVFERPWPGPEGVYRLWRQGLPQLDWPRRILFYLCTVLMRQETRPAPALQTPASGPAGPAG